VRPLSIGELAILAGAGGLGALARYGVGLAAFRLFGPHFPVGTLLVNVLGAFLLGVVMVLGEEAVAISPALRSALAIGFLGAFTTFSTFSYDTVMAWQHGKAGLAWLNVGLNLVLGIAAAWGGLTATRWLMRG